VKVILALGKIAWDSVLATALELKLAAVHPRPPFGHAAVTRLARCWLVGSYHVSQQNTFTGKLTPEMFDQVLSNCAQLSGG
jgi:uracil-DNA glycosylase